MFLSAANASDRPMSLCMLLPESPARHFGQEGEFVCHSSMLILQPIRLWHHDETMGSLIAPANLIQKTVLNTTVTVFENYLIHLWNTVVFVESGKSVVFIKFRLAQTNYIFFSYYIKW